MSRKAPILTACSAQQVRCPFLFLLVQRKVPILTACSAKQVRCPFLFLLVQRKAPILTACSAQQVRCPFLFLLVQRKVPILTACSAQQVRCPFLFLLVQMHHRWNSILSSNNPLHEKVVRADLLVANRSDTWTYQVLHALQDFPASQQLLNAKRFRESIHLKQFELTLCERIIGSWRELDNLTPQDNHHSSRFMRTYHTQFGVPLGIAPGWWDDRISNHKPVLPIYLVRSNNRPAKNKTQHIY